MIISNKNCIKVFGFGANDQIKALESIENQQEISIQQNTIETLSQDKETIDE
ncbi:MAG: hypothetical protein PHR53_00010 [Bacteroidales bacterium]|nr:hypothetical protein [Bacteroidales bacterium]